MDTISFLGTDWSVYQMFCFFAIYSVIGWFVETIYMTLETGYFDNRGFLNGPICPIYGFGMVFVLIALTPLVENAVLLFVGSVILTTSWEFLIGFTLEKIFHKSYYLLLLPITPWTQKQTTWPILGKVTYFIIKYTLFSKK